MKKLKLAVLIIFLALAGYVMWFGAQSSDFLRLKEITVQGASPDVEARLRKKLSLKVGDAFWKSPMEKEVENIKKEPWIENVEISRLFPSTLVIAVTERKPVAVLGPGDGQYKYVDSEGAVIDKMASLSSLAHYPVIAGKSLSASKDLRVRALELLKSLPDDGPLSKNDVSELNFNEEHGFQFTLNKSRLLVDIGKENLPLHVDRARRVVQYLDQHSINASHVDSDYAKKVLVKVRKDR